MPEFFCSFGDGLGRAGGSHVVGLSKHITQKEPKHSTKVCLLSRCLYGIPQTIPRKIRSDKWVVWCKDRS
jgi:hypothetical protein